MTTDPSCPWCGNASPRLVETSRYWCSKCQRDFVWYSPEEYAAAITAVRPAVLLPELLFDGIPVVFPSTDEPRKT